MLLPERRQCELGAAAELLGAVRALKQ